MPKNVISTDATELGSIPLPVQTETYTVVSHPFIINETLEQLKLNGFEVNEEEYTRNISGQVALGIYHLTHGNDPDLGLMFTWANSYDKSMRFRCAIGGFVHVSGSRMIAGDMSNYGRIHTGDAKDQVEEHLKSQIASASSYFTALCSDKDKMKDILLSDDQIAELMGILYFKEDVLTSSQLINTKEECKKATFNYTTPDNSLWTIYNHCILALKKSHPKTWMEQQKDLHKIVKARFLEVPAPVNAVIEELVDPAQISLLDQIEEVEAEETPTAVVEEPATFNLDHIESPIEEKVEEVVEEVPEEVVEELQNSEAELVQDPEALNLDAHKTEADVETEFAAPPSDMPVIGETNEVAQEIVTEQVEKVLKEELENTAEETRLPTSMKEVGMEEQQEVEEATPLEEQVAGEHVEPVTEAEEEVSAPPIVDEPIAHVETDLEYAERVANIDAVPEAEETTDIEDNNSNKETLESPFEY